MEIVSHLFRHGVYVRDNQRLAEHYRILMHDVEAKNRPT